VSGAGGLGGLRFSSVVLVHSARTVQDLALLNEIGAAIAAPGASRTPTSVHFAITGAGTPGQQPPLLLAPFPFSLSHGRITQGGLLARVWGARQGMCVVSGPQSMLDDVGQVAVRELGIPESMCHLLEA
jgi:ferredoxin-NADP reductase